MVSRYPLVIGLSLVLCGAPASATGRNAPGPGIHRQSGCPTDSRTGSRTRLTTVPGYRKNMWSHSYRVVDSCPSGGCTNSVSVGLFDNRSADTPRHTAAYQKALREARRQARLTGRDFHVELAVNPTQVPVNPGERFNESVGGGPVRYHQMDNGRFLVNGPGGMFAAANIDDAKRRVRQKVGEYSARMTPQQVGTLRDTTVRRGFHLDIHKQPDGSYLGRLIQANRHSPGMTVITSKKPVYTTSNADYGAVYGSLVRAAESLQRRRR